MEFNTIQIVRCLVSIREAMDEIADRLQPDDQVNLSDDVFTSWNSCHLDSITPHRIPFQDGMGFHGGAWGRFVTRLLGTQQWNALLLDLVLMVGCEHRE